MGDLHVTLYSGPETEEMNRARRFLERHKVNFEEKNVVMSTGAAGELYHYSGKTEYPAINVDGHIVVGFHPAKWEHLMQTRLRDR